MNKKMVLPLLTVFLFSSCHKAENETLFTESIPDTESIVRTTIAESSISVPEPSETVTIAVNENASLEEQIADTLYFMASTEDNPIHIGNYSLIRILDVNDDSIPEIEVFDAAGSAADFVDFYNLEGKNIGSFGIPSMKIEYNLVEKNNQKLFMVSGESINYNPQNGEAGPTEYNYINVFNFDNEENHIYFSYITYEDDTLENILSASVRTDNIGIDDTATIENINMYHDEFMSDYDTVNPIEPITLSITDADLSSKDAIIEKIAEQVREYEMHRME